MDLRKSTNAPSPLMSEVILRIVIWASFIFMELLTPFVRVIQPEEMWMYKYPYTGFQYVSASMLWVVSIIIPITILTVDYLKTKNKAYYRQGILCMTLLLGLNGFLTVLLKLIVGRPRPDFYHRCFPDGVGNASVDCTGDPKRVLEGRKSFPSGHASFSFASMMFVSLMLTHRLKLFEAHRGEAWRLIASLSPLVVATAISISRTCDYHHHWQDVACGGLLGSGLAYVCYYQYFPTNANASTRSSSSNTAVVAD